MIGDESGQWPMTGNGPRVGPVVMRFVSLANGTPSEYDGQYLAGYEPDGPVPIMVSTRDRALAVRFPHVAAAHREWVRPSGRVRTDGGVDRPLTAYTIEVLPADELELDGAL